MAGERKDWAGGSNDQVAASRPNDESVLRSRYREVVVLKSLNCALRSREFTLGKRSFLLSLLSCNSCVRWVFPELLYEYLFHKHTKISRCDMSFRTLGLLIRLAFPALKKCALCVVTVDVRTVV